MKQRVSPVLIIIFLLSLLILTTCSFISTDVKSLDYKKPGKSKTFTLKKPTKVHLSDGSVVVFKDGFSMTNEVLHGKGLRYDLTRLKKTVVESIPMDSVAAIEYYEKSREEGPFLTSAPPIILGGAIGTVALFKAIFGSCPTIYTFDGQRYTLEAEAFSYSIAKRFEAADLDRLDYGKVLNGKYILKISNEALETHYINNMSLLTVDYPAGYEAFPGNRQSILLFGKESEIKTAISKSGRDVSELISARDDRYYESDSLELRELTRNLTRDWVDLEVNVPAGAKNMAIAFRLRSTLMNTVLLYDMMLGAQGIEAINWLGTKTSNPLYAWRLNRWYKKHFGLHVRLFDGKKYREVARIGDPGPIAWHQQAVEIPVSGQKTARLRLDFLPDNVLIDWIGVSFDESGNYRVNTIESSAVSDFNHKRRDSIKTLIREKDRKYLVTYPGESYLLEFPVEPVPADRQRSYFLKSRGYYIEWLRKKWIVQNSGLKKSIKFALNDETIKRTAQLWLAKKTEFEKSFFELKIQLRKAQ